MKILILFISIPLFCLSLSAQKAFRVVIKDSTTLEALSGVTVSIIGSEKTEKLSDASGMIKFPPPSSPVEFELSYVGYKTRKVQVNTTDSIQTFLLQQDAQELSNVVVISSTRNNDRIENATTKVEVLGLEEMNEESTIKPGNIASILSDLSSIQIQQSSAVSGNANIRIQGLDGRYTQILRDGMPLYGGYSGGFGILSIAPLDLKQIELIKGAASTLYGGGAIGGLVNLVSKKPSYTPDASILVNQTSLKETNMNVYYAQRWKKVGFTLFAGQTFQKEVDVNKDGFSDVPKLNSTTIHPILFFYPSTHLTVSIGWSGNFEKRTGGDMLAIDGQKDANHPYFEKNTLNRNIFTLITEDRINSTLVATVKASVSIFNRDELTNTYLFKGNQKNYYAEASLVKHLHDHSIVGGINITGDDFKPNAETPVPIGEFSNDQLGFFIQDTWQINKLTKLETGLRYDHQSHYEDFLLPRIALFRHLNENWGTRIGFGMGYANPNPLTPQIRDYSIEKIMPIGPDVEAEKSYGGNIDVNYKKEFAEGKSIFINESFFITRVAHPLVGTEDITGNVSFNNAGAPVSTKGFDTYIQIELPKWEFYIGYTYTDALRKYLDQNQFMPITPRHRAATTIVFQEEGNWRIGAEAAYNSYQYREDYTKTPGYLFVAAMIEKKFGPKWSLVLNCENILDERQSRYETLYTGTVANPVFKTLWAPIDGRAFNICLRLQPFAKRD